MLVASLMLLASHPSPTHRATISSAQWFVHSYKHTRTTTCTLSGLHSMVYVYTEMPLSRIHGNVYILKLLQTACGDARRDTDIVHIVRGGEHYNIARFSCWHIQTYTLRERICTFQETVIMPFNRTTIAKNSQTHTH